MTNTQNKITKISFLLVEEFSMIAFASALEPLRAANRISKKKLFVSTPNNPTSVLNEAKLITNDLSSDLSNSDIQFTYNTYSSTHSNDYEKSFALENMKASANISSYTTPTFLLDESNLKESFTNFSF